VLWRILLDGVPLLFLCCTARSSPATQTDGIVPGHGLGACHMNTTLAHSRLCVLCIVSVMSNITIVDPPAPPTGTTLVFNLDSLASSVLYPVGGTVSSPTFKFETVRDNHIVLRTGGAGGAVAGEIVYYGMFKKGLGTVKVGDGRALKIEDWGTVTDRCMVVPIGEMYVWNKEVHTSPNKNIVTEVIYEVSCFPQQRLGRVLMPGVGQSRRQGHGHIHTLMDKRAYVLLVRSDNCKPRSGIPQDPDAGPHPFCTRSQREGVRSATPFSFPFQGHCPQERETIPWRVYDGGRRVGSRYADVSISFESRNIF
jgi:hypothetical protein